MAQKRNRYHIIYTGFFIALLYWLCETLMHYYVFNPEWGFRLWPPESNEQWMRSFICLLLVGFSVYAQFVNTRSLKIEQDKFAVFKATMNTVMDIEGNFLNNLTLYQMELEETQTLSPASQAEINTLIRTTHRRLQTLAEAASIKEEMAAGLIPIIKTNHQEPQ